MQENRFAMIFWAIFGADRKGLYFSRRVKIWILFLVLISGSISCDQVYRFLDEKGAQEKDLIGEVVPYEKNPSVEEVQGLLKLYGYDPGKVDGVLGGGTREAIARFQTDNQLAVSRYVDDETWRKLSVFKENKIVVENELNIKLVQDLLTRAGFFPGKIDGKMGKKTKDAVKEFQKAKELKVDGKIGYWTLTELAFFLTPTDAEKDDK